jgi:hypothetical protein
MKNKKKKKKKNKKKNKKKIKKLSVFHGLWGEMCSDVPRRYALRTYEHYTGEYTPFRAGLASGGFNQGEKYKIFQVNPLEARLRPLLKEGPLKVSWPSLMTNPNLIAMFHKRSIYRYSNLGFKKFKESQLNWSEYVFKLGERE